MAKTEDTIEAGENSPASFVGNSRSDPPRHHWVLRPHRSLPVRGFVLTIAFTAVMFTVPLVPLLGSKALWGLLPHLLLVLGLLWYLLRRNDRDGTLFEELKIWTDLITVHRHNPRKDDQFWQANPYWVRVQIKDNPHVENYLTLKGGEREIELGAFLTPEERLELCSRIEDALKRV
ncbi:MAG: DUF2244 domain-containing protein [Rhodobacteraceae bacterium]|nr:DUF2244 domain-containing protein [Paracoccaceae bacterium]